MSAQNLKELGKRRPVFQERVGLGFMEGTYISRQDAAEAVQKIEGMSAEEIMAELELSSLQGDWTKKLAEVMGITANVAPLVGTLSAIIVRDMLSQEYNQRMRIFSAVKAKLGEVSGAFKREVVSTKDIPEVKRAIEMSISQSQAMQASYEAAAD
jgi:hypothetical protein